MPEDGFRSGRPKGFEAFRATHRLTVGENSRVDGEKKVAGSKTSISPLTSPFSSARACSQGAERPWSGVPGAIVYLVFCRVLKLLVPSSAGGITEDNVDIVVKGAKSRSASTAVSDRRSLAETDLPAQWATSPRPTGTRQRMEMSAIGAPCRVAARSAGTQCSCQLLRC